MQNNTKNNNSIEPMVIISMLKNTDSLEIKINEKLAEENKEVLHSKITSSFLKEEYKNANKYLGFVEMKKNKESEYFLFFDKTTNDFVFSTDNYNIQMIFFDLINKNFFNKTKSNIGSTELLDVIKIEQKASRKFTKWFYNLEDQENIKYLSNPHGVLDKNNNIIIEVKNEKTNKIYNFVIKSNEWIF